VPSNVLKASGFRLKHPAGMTVMEIIRKMVHLLSSVKPKKVKSGQKSRELSPGRYEYFNLCEEMPNQS